MPRTLGLVASAKSLPTEGKRLFATGWSPGKAKTLARPSARPCHPKVYESLWAAITSIPGKIGSARAPTRLELVNREAA